MRPIRTSSLAAALSPNLSAAVAGSNPLAAPAGDDSCSNAGSDTGSRASSGGRNTSGSTARKRTGRTHNPYCSSVTAASLDENRTANVNETPSASPLMSTAAAVAAVGHASAPRPWSPAHAPSHLQHASSSSGASPLTMSPHARATPQHTAAFGPQAPLGGPAAGWGWDARLQPVTSPGWDPTQPNGSLVTSPGWDPTQPNGSLVSLPAHVMPPGYAQSQTPLVQQGFSFAQMGRPSGSHRLGGEIGPTADPHMAGMFATPLGEMGDSDRLRESPARLSPGMSFVPAGRLYSFVDIGHGPVGGVAAAEEPPHPQQASPFTPQRMQQLPVPQPPMPRLASQQQHLQQPVAQHPQVYLQQPTRLESAPEPQVVVPVVAHGGNAHRLGTMHASPMHPVPLPQAPHDPSSDTADEAPPMPRRFVRRDTAPMLPAATPSAETPYESQSLDQPRAQPTRRHQNGRGRGAQQVSAEDLERRLAEGERTRQHAVVGPGIEFSVFDSGIALHYAIDGRDVVITRGAIKYVEHHLRFGQQTRFRFQLCRNFTMMRCTRGGSCSYIHALKLPTPSCVHINTAPVPANMRRRGHEYEMDLDDEAMEQAKAYETLPYDFVLWVHPPNAGTRQNEKPHQLSSHLILRTTGSVTAFNLLLQSAGLPQAYFAPPDFKGKWPAVGECVTSSTGEQSVHILSARDVATAAPVVLGSDTGPRPKHCAHFQFKRLCHLGPSCHFIHALITFDPDISNQPSRVEAPPQPHPRLKQITATPRAVAPRALAPPTDVAAPFQQPQQQQQQQPQQPPQLPNRTGQPGQPQWTLVPAAMPPAQPLPGYAAFAATQSLPGQWAPPPPQQQQPQPVHRHHSGQKQHSQQQVSAPVFHPDPFRTSIPAPQQPPSAFIQMPQPVAASGLSGVTIRVGGMSVGAAPMWQKSSSS